MAEPAELKRNDEGLRRPRGRRNSLANKGDGAAGGGQDVVASSPTAGLIELQGQVGNSVVARSMRRHSPRVGAATIIRRQREDNPHAQKGTAGGWDLTAHHVIAHSKLVAALARLDDDDRKKVLIAAIPTKVEPGMLESVGLVIPADLDVSPEAWAEGVRLELVKEDAKETIGNIRTDDIRASFFEWQGGNQFMGPNTSTRAEPSEAKDAVDSDIQHLGAGHWEDLDQAGGELSTLMTGKGKGKPASSGDIASKLTEILAITKDVKPTAFDPDQWHEVTSLDEIDALARSKVLGRKHLTKYAFFKFAIGDAKGSSPKYDGIKPVGAGPSHFSYGTVKNIGAAIRGTSAYISLTEAKKKVPKVTQGVTVKDFFANHDVAVVAKGKDLTVTIPKELFQFTDGKILSLKGAKGVVRISGGQNPEFTLAPGALAGKLTVTSDGRSLFQYCVDEGMPTSTWLPKALYEKVKAHKD